MHRLLALFLQGSFRSGDISPPRNRNNQAGGPLSLRICPVERACHGDVRRHFADLREERYCQSGPAVIMAYEQTRNPSVTRANDAAVCARCAAVGSTCCTLTPGQEDLCFPVSEIERQRIVEFGPPRGGLTGAPNSSAFLDHLTRLFPRDRERLEQAFPSHGEHLRLATHPDGRCTFLCSTGCILPREARPYYCRLFPFWVSAGAVTAFEAKGCLACREGRFVSGMLPLFNLKRAAVQELHGRMRMAWGLPPQESGQEPGRKRTKVGNNA
jgi:Fe-S-cluster containining protein